MGITEKCFGRIRYGMVCLLLCGILLLNTVPSVVHADTGPKPSVVVDFTGAPEGIYYATLLSEKESTGPASAWDGSDKYADYHEGDKDYEIWKAFVEYKDSDGFYFLQWFWDCSEKDQFAWSYYPPQTFKVLVYFPESDTFFVTGIQERYAFDSYFTVDLSTGTSVAGEAPSAEYEEEKNPELAERTENLIQAEKSYNYTAELLSMAARIVITILIEIGLAWLVGFREKKVLNYIVLINVVTQIILNVLLNVANYNSGQLTFVVKYIFYEFVVTVIELAAYLLGVRRLGEKEYKRRDIIVYTLVSNIVSFAAGMWIAQVIPGIF